MSERKRTAIYWAIGAILLGACILFVSLRMIRFDLRRLNTEKFETRTVNISEPFDSLDLRTISSDVHLLPSPDGTCRVEWDESEHIVTEAAVKNGVLTVEQRDERRWYESVGFFWFREAGTTIYLSPADYGSLSAKTTSGDIEVSEELSFGAVRLESTSGDVNFRGDAAQTFIAKTVSGTVNISGLRQESSVPLPIESTTLWVATTSGDVFLEDVSSHDLDIETVSGDIRLTDAVTATATMGSTSGEIRADRLTVHGTASAGTVSGDILLDNFDSGDTYLTSTSGNITVVFLSNKRFVINTTSGHVDRPGSDINAPLCQVKTTSGDITLRYAGE